MTEVVYGVKVGVKAMHNLGHHSTPGFLAFVMSQYIYIFRMWLLRTERKEEDNQSSIYVGKLIEWRCSF